MNRIAELRDEKGITQVQLAEYIGVSQSTLSRWELEANILDTALAGKIADYFKVTLDYLCMRSDLPQATAISAKESEMLNIYRSLSHEKREAIYNVVKTVSK